LRIHNEEVTRQLPLRTKSENAETTAAGELPVLNSERRNPMARYGKKAQQKVKRAMHERKRGKLKSGRSGKKVKSRKQAIAIGLSEARRAGGKVPRKKSKKK
jgi:hypothetical protein